jgi:hypothetical protein
MLSAVVVIVTLFTLSSCSVSDEEGKLIFAHVVSVDSLRRRFKVFQSLISPFFLARQIFRHGDRTPVEPYPNDPWKDPKWWPVGFGQLTNVSSKFFITSSSRNLTPSNWSIVSFIVQSWSKAS